ncbi:C4-dicarboxylate transporter DcuC [uncultured Fusobacterium sp.]|uniref:C4-dicarboxylate transporter DcuC n=1 Tax=uncultured Fusobacterium sp. TaxID=159267 RepID=UPI0025F7C7C3|nr:C4-dicarboxylate transporter DcuC [uncultured Fusobacterium sp.]
MNFVLAILVIIAVGYFIVKKYQAQGVLLIGGAILLLGGILLNDSPVMAKSATGSLYLDIFSQLSKNFIKTSGSLGLAIMIVSAFAKYMDHIGASTALVKLSIKPLQKLNSPYIVLALSYVIGQILNVFIPSASGLGVLLMVTVYPIVVSLGVSSLAATAVIGTSACLDLGPASGNAVLASKTAEMDAALYFANYQIPVAIATVIVITILHYFVNKKMDSKLDVAESKADLESKEEDKEVPKFYAFLPIIPLLIILMFSPLTGSSIKIGVVEAMFMSITLSMIIEGVRRRAFKSTLAELKIIFTAMGSQFANVITLIVAGEFFALGLTKIGVISALIDSTKSAGLGAQPMILVMTAIIVVSSILMGSGNAPFFAFAALAPAVAASVDLNPIVMLMPMQLSAGIARSVSPITAVIVAVAGISGVSPFDVVKRTAIPMLGGLIAVVITNMVLFG